jgi:drug/metabolite transporter (DMT)-like permease
LTVAGSVVSFVGVVITTLLTSSPSTISMMGGLIHLGKGELQVAIASLLLAVATVLSKLRLQQIPLGFFSLFRTTIGTIIFFILAHYIYGSQHFAEAFSPFLWGWMLIYGAIIVAAGQLFSFAGLKNASVPEITFTNSIKPLAAIAFAYLILQEVPTVAQYWGGSIILIGIILGAIGNLKQTQSSSLTLGRYMEMVTGFRGI